MAFHAVGEGMQNCGRRLSGCAPPIRALLRPLRDIVAIHGIGRKADAAGARRRTFAGGHGVRCRGRR